MDPDAITFGYDYSGNMMVCRGRMHSDLGELYGGVDINRDDMNSAGRLWYDSKIITFWGRYPDRSQLKVILEDIKKEMESMANGTSKNISTDPRVASLVLNKFKSLDINSMEWDIEVPTLGKMYDKYAWMADTDTGAGFRDLNWTGSDEYRFRNDKAYETYIIPVGKYQNANTQFDPVDHVKSPMIKQASYTPGFGADYRPAGLSATQYHQLIRTSESKKPNVIKIGSILDSIKRKNN